MRAVAWGAFALLSVLAGCLFPAAEKSGNGGNTSTADSVTTTTASGTTTAVASSSTGSTSRCLTPQGADLCSGLELWLDAKDLVDGAVTTWPDRSPHHRDATQTLPIARPSFAFNAALGTAAVAFDGVDDQLVVPALDHGFPAGISFFAIVVPNRVDVAQQMVAVFAPSVDSDMQALGLTLDHETWGVFRDDYSAVQDQALVAGEARLLAARVTWGTDSRLARCNQPETTENAVVVDGRNEACTLNGIGGGAKGAKLDGAIAELLVYDGDVDSTTRDAVLGYLRTKWNACP